LTNLPATITPNDIITTDDADWIDHLTENIAAIIVEAGFAIRQTKIRMYWLMGQEIVTEERRQSTDWQANQRPNPPASRAYIFRHVGDRLTRYAGFIGTGKTALYDATNFAELCPTEDKLEDTLQRLETGKNANWRYVCRKLLPGHENDHAPSTPRTLYNGPATVNGPPHRRVAALPIGATLDALAGDEVHIIIKEATSED